LLLIFSLTACGRVGKLERPLEFENIYGLEKSL